jgi:5-methylcytosine-specific restriction endonuclease McrA
MSFITFKKKAIKLNCYKTNQNWNKGKSAFNDERINTKHSLFCENSSARREYIKGLIVKHDLIDYVCSECGLNNEWNNKVLCLQIDHINGIRNDNRLENLRFLCPNCHSQTETWCSKNNTLTVNTIDLELLKSTIFSSLSVTEIIRRLGFCDTKSNRLQIKKTMKDNNFNFSVDEKLYNKTDNKIEKIFTCKCGEIIKKNSKQCKKCKYTQSRMTERPSYIDLIEEVNKNGFSATGRKYGVSDNAIRKWIKYYQKNCQNFENE